MHLDLLLRHFKASLYMCRVQSGCISCTDLSTDVSIHSDPEELLKHRNPETRNRVKHTYTHANESTLMVASPIYKGV